MKLDLAKYALNNLWKRKKRSFLTILSVFIGVMAVFALISFGTGIQNYMDSIAVDMGVDKILIQPEGGFGNPAASSFKFDDDDLDFLRKIDGVAEVSASLVEEAIVQSDLKKRGSVIFLVSLPMDESLGVIEELLTVDIEYGRQLKKGDKARVAVGSDYLLDNKIFKKGLSIGEKMYVNEMEVQIVGAFESLGNPGDDRNLYMTEEGMTEVLGYEKEYGWMVARAGIGENPSELAEKMEDRFRRYRNEDEGKETFRIETVEDMIQSFKDMINIINIFLIVISAVSILVSVVNIMNTMYTAVLERTQEIGIMKAIGAQNRSILFIFVFEAGVLGLLGSAVGMGLGYLIAEFGGFIAASSGLTALKPAYPIILIIGVLVAGFALGAVSGLAPAVQASRQKPVESLRYE